MKSIRNPGPAFQRMVLRVLGGWKGTEELRRIRRLGKTTPLREWQVLCRWCGASPGQPCFYPKADGSREVYTEKVHRPRKEDFDKR